MRNIFCFLIFIFILTSKFSVALSLKEIIPQGYEIRDSISGDLNHDRYPDMIIVTRKMNEETLALVNDSTLDRETIILYGNDNGYSIVSRNKNVVMCITCGGLIGDPYQGINIENGNFTVSHYGGAYNRWSLVSTFAKNNKGTWMLVKEVNETFDADNESSTKRTETKTSSDFGSVTFESYEQKLK